MENLVLTATEYTALAEVTIRRFQALQRDAAAKPKLKEDRLYMAYEDLAKLMHNVDTKPTDPLELVTLAVSRQDLRLLESLAGAHIKALEEYIIPGYRERGDKKKYNFYIDKAQNAVALFTRIQKKAQEGL